MTTSESAAGGPLDGLRVLDLSIWRPGPYATQLLCEMGADVIKVEPPGGDPMRVYPELFAALNARKRSVMFDLKDQADRSECLELAAHADVVIEAFRPGVAARLGVDDVSVRARNPEVIYCSLSGMGQFGPLAQAPGHDVNFQAWAGTLTPDGGDAVISRLPVADLAGGMAAALAISAAFAHRLITGEGERIDLAMADVLATWTGAATARNAAREVDSTETLVPGYGIFECADGSQIALGIVSEDHFWAALCDVLGLSELAHEDFSQRMAGGERMQAALSDALARQDRDALVSELLAAGVPASPVLDRAGMLASSHFRERGVVKVALDGSLSCGPPIRFERARARAGGAVPSIDEHRGTSFAARDRAS
jgi:crotonobetainyl-CoA:carnitine CoA-transferase CaiB-like acyl-CoA transferase